MKKSKKNARGIFAAWPTTPPSSVCAPLSPSSPICEGGKGQLQQPCVKVLGLEHSATLSLELFRGINGAGNLCEGRGIRASSITLSSNNLASFYYSRGRYFETSGISWELALCKVLDPIFVVLASF